AFAERVEQQLTRRMVIAPPSSSGETDAPIIEVRDAALREVLAALGVDVAALRRERATLVRTLPSLSSTIAIAAHTSGVQSAPNLVGLIEGTDSLLKHEYVVFSAHMDHGGVRPPSEGSRDSVWNGADDDASGTAGVIELAEAFSRPTARPRRSLIF